MADWCRPDTFRETEKEWRNLLSGKPERWSEAWNWSDTGRPQEAGIDSGNVSKGEHCFQYL